MLARPFLQAISAFGCLPEHIWSRRASGRKQKRIRAGACAAWAAWRRAPRSGPAHTASRPALCARVGDCRPSSWSPLAADAFACCEHAGFAPRAQSTRAFWARAAAWASAHALACAALWRRSAARPARVASGPVSTKWTSSFQKQNNKASRRSVAHRVSAASCSCSQPLVPNACGAKAGTARLRSCLTGRRRPTSVTAASEDGRPVASVSCVSGRSQFYVSVSAGPV